MGVNLLYICTIIGTSLGFGKIYSKDQERKTRNASFYKIVLLILALLISWFFYIKTYQIATLKSIVTIERYKGAFDETDSVCKDEISNIIFFTKFIDRRWQDDIYISDMGDELKSSGLLMYSKLNNDSNVYHKLCKIYNGEKQYILPPIDTLKHLYKIDYAATSVPNLFPLLSTTTSKRLSTHILEDGVTFISTRDYVCDVEDVAINKTDYTLNENVSGYGTYSSNLIYTEKKPKSREDDFWFKMGLVDDKINNLSVFSLADLSQCVFEFQIKSDIPINSISLFLDVPANFSALDIERDKVTYNGFTLSDLSSITETGSGLIRVHAKLPTQENLQLIRSLILTSIITALFSLLISNIFYYSRKINKRRTRYNKLKWVEKLKLKFFWIPAVKRLAVLFFILLFLWLLLLSTNSFVSVSEEYTGFMILWSIVIIIVISSIIIGVTYYSYTKFVKQRHTIRTCQGKSKVCVNNKTQTKNKKGKNKTERNKRRK